VVEVAVPKAESAPKLKGEEVEAVAAEVVVEGVAPVHQNQRGDFTASTREELVKRKIIHYDMEMETS
jgi:hypothetical protein